MCMQDLAINSRISWRPALTARPATLGGVGYSMLPPSPIRVAAYCHTPGSPNPLRLYTSPDGVLPHAMPSQAGASATCLYAHVRDFPGVFSEPVYAADPVGNGVWWEAVMDSDLSLAVQVLAQQITIIGRSNGG